MSFKSYAEGRGFKNFLVEIPIREHQEHILREGKDAATFIKNRSEEFTKQRNEEFQIIARSMEAMDR